MWEEEKIKILTIKQSHQLLKQEPILSTKATLFYLYMKKASKIKQN